MNNHNKLIIEVKRFPESQEVMDKKGWFPIGDYGDEMIIGDSAYGRVMEDDEYILTEKTTADEYNKEYAEDIDLQAFAQGRKSSFDNNIEEKTTADEFHNKWNINLYPQEVDYIENRDPGDENES